MQISRWSHAVTAQIGAMQSRETMLANAAKIAELQHYLIGKMKEREASPREDMISDIVHAETTNEDGVEREADLRGGGLADPGNAHRRQRHHRNRRSATCSTCWPPSRAWPSCSPNAPRTSAG